MPNKTRRRHYLPLVSGIAISLLAHLVIFLLVGYFFWTNIAKLLPKQKKSPIVLSTIMVNDQESQPESESLSEKPRAEVLSENTTIKKEDKFQKTLDESVPVVLKEPAPKKFTKKPPETQKKVEKTDTALPTSGESSVEVPHEAPREMPRKSSPLISDSDIETALGVEKITGINVESLEHDYQQALLRELTKYKKYPDTAVRRGLEGDVAVAFTVLKDGEITRLKIQESSGWKILDRAAIKSLKRLGQFKPIPAELNRDTWEFIVTIHFSIE